MERFVTYGTGEPTTMIFPGLSHAVEDWKEFAAHFGETIVVPRNMFHEGMKEPAGVSWPDAWQQELMKLLERFPLIARVIAQSRGIVDILMIAELTKHIKDAVLVTPPIGDKVHTGKARVFGHGDDPDARVLDSCLASLSPDMDEETYRSFVQRHKATYGSNFRRLYKTESPKTTHLKDRSTQLLRTVCSSIRMRMIVGMQDLWHDEEELAIIQAARPSMQVERINTGHFPHVSAPGLLAHTIKQHL